MEQDKQEKMENSEEILNVQTAGAEDVPEGMPDTKEPEGSEAEIESGEGKSIAETQSDEGMERKTEEIKESSEAPEGEAEDIKGSAETAEGEAEDVKRSAEAPEGEAEDVKESAETSEGEAEDIKGSAETSEGEAEGLKGNSEASEEKTEDAGKGAEKAEDKAELMEHQEENVASSNKTTGKKKKILIPICVLLVLLAVCACVYSAIAFSYRDKFLPGTWINGIDCSELDGAQVAGLLENQLQDYGLEVTGRDYANGDSEAILGTLTAQDIHLTYGEKSRGAVDELLAEQAVFTWMYRKLSDDTYSLQLIQGTSYDEEQMESIVREWAACRPDNMISPQNAYISDYSETLKGYEIVPEVEGTEFDVPKLLELIDVAIISHGTSLDLEAEGCYAEPTVRQDAAELTEPVETVNKWLGARIVYDWNGTEVIVDIEQLREWITMGADGPVLDEKAVEAFVKEQAEEYDTYGKRRSFTTTHGVTLSLPSGHYGWLTDKEAETKELIELIREGRSVSREPVYASTARQKGMNDIGNSYVEVDLTHQHLYLYEGGTVVFETDFVSGSMSSTPDCVTPEGVFGITYKTTNAVLRGADYETPVFYWMPFYGNYGMHDATWRDEFGGQIYIENGSHGCVNLPLGSAAVIYEHMSTGFPVICYYYQVDPLADQHVDDWWDDDDDDDEE